MLTGSIKITQLCVDVTHQYHWVMRQVFHYQLYCALEKPVKKEYKGTKNPGHKKSRKTRNLPGQIAFL